MVTRRVWTFVRERRYVVQVKKAVEGTVKWEELIDAGFLPLEVNDEAS